MVIAIHQHKSALGIHTSPPSWTPIPSPSPSHPLSCHKALGFGSLHHTLNSHWLSILHMVMYIKRHLLLGRKVMTNLDSILKSRDIANKGPSGQGYGFSSGHVWM